MLKIKNTNYHELPTNYSYNINVSNMKKEYIQPTMHVVKIQQQRMLCGSNPYNDVKSPVSVYNDPEDVIEDKGDIW